MLLHRRNKSFATSTQLLEKMPSAAKELYGTLINTVRGKVEAGIAALLLVGLEAAFYMDTP